MMLSLEATKDPFEDKATSLDSKEKSKICFCISQFLQLLSISAKYWFFSYHLSQLTVDLSQTSVDLSQPTVVVILSTVELAA